MANGKRGTRKHQSSSHRQRATAKAKAHLTLTIPELRHAFEYMEQYVRSRLSEPMDALIPSVQDEWKRVFYKELDRPSAVAYIEYVRECDKEAAVVAKKARRHTRRKRGGAGMLEGAPIEYMLRPGVYITPGIDQGSYAMVPKYVASGFWNPEPGHSYDPVPGQTHYPTRTPAGVGDNTVNGGAVIRQHKLRGGNALLSQAFMRPIISSSPPSVGQDMETIWNGQMPGASPEASQPSFKYL